MQGVSSSVVEQVAIEDVGDTRVATSAAMAFATALGAERREAWEFSIAVAEAATNIVRHGVRGSVRFHWRCCSPVVLVFETVDEGPGIDDAEAAKRDGFSRGRVRVPGEVAESLGAGLGAIVRSMSRVAFLPGRAGGTVVRGEKDLDSRSLCPCRELGAFPHP